MKLTRILCASSVATGIGLAGLLGAGLATANAAPAPGGAAGHAGPGVQQVGDKIKPTHHQKKEIGKQAEKQAKHNGLAVN